MLTLTIPLLILNNHTGLRWSKAVLFILRLLLSISKAYNKILLNTSMKPGHTCSTVTNLTVLTLVALVRVCSENTPTLILVVGGVMLALTLVLSLPPHQATSPNLKSGVALSPISHATTQTSLVRKLSMSTLQKLTSVSSCLMSHQRSPIKYMRKPRSTPLRMNAIVAFGTAFTNTTYPLPLPRELKKLLAS